MEAPTWLPVWGTRRIRREPEREWEEEEKGARSCRWQPVRGAQTETAEFYGIANPVVFACI